MLELSTKTNLLEENDYRYSLQDVKDPVLYRDVYNYEEIPKVAFNHRRVPISMPEDIWITDTSFRDGQQAFHPYTPEQIETLYKLMSKLGGPYGIIRQTEFFIYSKKDRDAIERCRSLGLTDFQDSDLVYTLAVTCPPAVKLTVRRLARQAVMEVFCSMGIAIPYPQMDVHMTRNA